MRSLAAEAHTQARQRTRAFLFPPAPPPRRCTQLGALSPAHLQRRSLRHHFVCTPLPLIIQRTQLSEPLARGYQRALGGCSLSEASALCNHATAHVSAKLLGKGCLLLGAQQLGLRRQVVMERGVSWQEEIGP